MEWVDSVIELLDSAMESVDSDQLCYGVSRLTYQGVVTPIHAYLELRLGSQCGYQVTEVISLQSQGHKVISRQNSKIKECTLYCAR